MKERKRLLVFITVGLMFLFLINPSNVFANSDSGLPSVKDLVNQLEQKVDSLISNVELINNSVSSLQEQVDTQKTEIAQLQKQVDELKNQNSNTSTQPITISIDSFAGEDSYSGQTFPIENLKNKKIIITDAADVSKTYTVTTDGEGKATVTLPAGLYLFDFDPNLDYHGSDFFLVTDKVPNPKIALVSFYGGYQLYSNIEHGVGVYPSKEDESNYYLSQF